jgi:hypothetical protein
MKKKWYYGAFSGMNHARVTQKLVEIANANMLQPGEIVVVETMAITMACTHVFFMYYAEKEIIIGSSY